MTADPASHEMTPADAFMAAEAALMELDAMARGALEDGASPSSISGSLFRLDSWQAFNRLVDAANCLTPFSRKSPRL